MTDEQISISTKAAFKTFDGLKPGQGVDISKTKTYVSDQKVMIDICKAYIDIQRFNDNDFYEMSEDYKIIKHT